MSDGAGGWRPCAFGPRCLEPAGEVRRRPAVRARRSPSPSPSLKGERPELVVQKLTELGVDRIVPFVAARSRGALGRRPGATATSSGCAGWPGRRPCRAGGRWLPVVDPVQPFAAVASAPGAVLADGGGGPADLDRPMVLVGPEGGWAPEEATCGRPTVGLGPHVLRAETAAIAAGALLVALRAGLV